MLELVRSRLERRAKGLSEPRRWQKDNASIPFDSQFSSKVVVYGHPLAPISETLTRRTPLPIGRQSHSGGDSAAVAAPVQSSSSSIRSSHNYHLIILLLLCVICAFPYHRPLGYLSNRKADMGSLTCAMIPLRAVHTKARQLVTWCFELCQPQRNMSGLKTNFSLSPSYLICRSLNYKSLNNSVKIFHTGTIATQHTISYRTQQSLSEGQNHTHSFEMPIGKDTDTCFGAYLILRGYSTQEPASIVSNDSS